MVNIQYTAQGFEFLADGKMYRFDTLEAAIAQLTRMMKEYHVPANTRPSPRFVRR